MICKGGGRSATRAVFVDARNVEATVYKANRNALLVPKPPKKCEWLKLGLFSMIQI